MTVAAWQAGHLYLPDTIVRSTARAPVTNQAITNPGFESGDTAWSKSNTTIVSEAGSFTGSYHAKMVYSGGATGYVRTTSILPVSPGQSVTASCMYNPSGASIGVGGQVRILWYNASNTYISGKDAVGNGIDTSNGSGWRKSSVTGSAPASAAGFKVQGDTYNTATAGVVLLDAFTLVVAGGPAANNLVFKATQADAATSGTSEPVWPTTVGGTVVDGGVTWTAIDAVVVTWEASPVLESGSTEPTWPTNLGDTVADGSIAWEAISRRIEDENCPNTKVVLILSSKVFAVDEDIVRFSATANPKDWTSEQDAGYLPTGLQSSNASDMSVLAAYRNNLIPMNASCLQNWQVDPDPQSMALLDQMDGIGSIYNMAAQPVANDLFYLSQLGVRSIGIAASTDNLAAGDIGMPIDELVQDAIEVAQGTGVEPLATYYPGAGQYWLAVPPLDAVACSIATTFQGGRAVPSITVITIGSDTGQMLFKFATGFCPDRAEVWIGGAKVLDTGWWGDPSWQDDLDAACAAAGISSGTIHDVADPTHDAYEQWDAGDAISFAIDKSTADTTAIVKIFAPVGGTAWKFLLSCPGDAVVGPSIAGEAPDGIIGEAYTFTYTITAGDAAIVRTTIDESALLPGLSWDETTATISGTPTVAGNMAITPRAIDENGLFDELSDTIAISGTEILPPQLSDWRYLQIDRTDATDYSSLLFDDSAWSTGTAPFGAWEAGYNSGDVSDGAPTGLNAAPEYDHRFAATFATTWANNTRLWLRRTLTLASIPAADLLVTCYIEDNCHFYINGDLVITTPANHDRGVGQTFTIDTASLIVGDNIIAIRCDDEAPNSAASVTYADFIIENAS